MASPKYSKDIHGNSFRIPISDKDMTNINTTLDDPEKNSNFFYFFKKIFSNFFY